MRGVNYYNINLKTMINDWFDLTTYNEHFPMKPHLICVGKQADKVVFLEKKRQMKPWNHILSCKHRPEGKMTWEEGRCSCTVALGRGTVPSSPSKNCEGLIFLSRYDFFFTGLPQKSKGNHLLTHTPIFWHASLIWFELPHFWSVNYTLHCFHRDTLRDNISKCHINHIALKKLG